MTGCGCDRDRVYLIDYGHAEIYRCGVRDEVQQYGDYGHIAYRKNAAVAHEGTIAFTSIDAHDGVSECTFTLV